ncbi:MAG: DUF559 domain-containing protein [Rhizomicrobium sp.]
MVSAKARFKPVRRRAPTRHTASRLATLPALEEGKVEFNLPLAGRSIRRNVAERSEAGSGGGIALAKAFARTLRDNQTDAERVLWAGLREFKQAGLHFRRQVPIGPYVVDFACHRAKLIVELDGDQHGEDRNIVYDAERTAFLNSRGYHVIRFANWEVLRERERVLEHILRVAQSPHPPRHSVARHPPRVGGG